MLENSLQCPGSGHSISTGRKRLEVTAEAYTRRGKAERTKQARKSKKSWSQVHDKYLKPFALDVFISANYVTAKVMHRVTSKVMSVASSSSSKDFGDLTSRMDITACERVGEVLGERTKRVDVFAVTLKLKKDQRLEGKLAAVVNAISRTGVIVMQ